MIERKPGTGRSLSVPLLVGIGGAVLMIVGWVIYGLHDANMFGVSSTTAFQEQTRLAGNAARAESYWNLFLVVPAEVVAALGFTMHFRRMTGAPRFFRKATTISLVAMPFYVALQTLVRVTILVGMGRVDLDDPTHVVQASDTIIFIIVAVGTLANWAFNFVVLPVLIMGLTLLGRRLRNLRPRSPRDLHGTLHTSSGS